MEPGLCKDLSHLATSTCNKCPTSCGRDLTGTCRKKFAWQVGDLTVTCWGSVTNKTHVQLFASASHPRVPRGRGVNDKWISMSTDYLPNIAWKIRWWNILHTNMDLKASADVKISTFLVKYGGMRLWIRKWTFKVVIVLSRVKVMGLCCKLWNCLLAKLLSLLKS